MADQPKSPGMRMSDLIRNTQARSIRHLAYDNIRRSWGKHAPTDKETSHG